MITEEVLPRERNRSNSARAVTSFIHLLWWFLSPASLSREFTQLGPLLLDLETPLWKADGFQVPLFCPVPFPGLGPSSQCNVQVQCSTAPTASSCLPVQGPVAQGEDGTQSGTRGRTDTNCDHRGSAFGLWTGQLTFMRPDGPFFMLCGQQPLEKGLRHVACLRSGTHTHVCLIKIYFLLL